MDNWYLWFNERLAHCMANRIIGLHKGLLIGFTGQWIHECPDAVTENQRDYFSRQVLWSVCGGECYGVECFRVGCYRVEYYGVECYGVEYWGMLWSVRMELIAIQCVYGVLWKSNRYWPGILVSLEYLGLVKWVKTREAWRMVLYDGVTEYREECKWAEMRWVNTMTHK